MRTYHQRSKARSLKTRTPSSGKEKFEDLWLVESSLRPSHRELSPPFSHRELFSLLDVAQSAKIGLAPPRMLDHSPNANKEVSRVPCPDLVVWHIFNCSPNGDGLLLSALGTEAGASSLSLLLSRRQLRHPTKCAVPRRAGCSCFRASSSSLPLHEERRPRHCAKPESDNSILQLLFEAF